MAAPLHLQCSSDKKIVMLHGGLYFSLFLSAFGQVSYKGGKWIKVVYCGFCANGMDLQRLIHGKTKAQSLAVTCTMQQASI